MVGGALGLVAGPPMGSIMVRSMNELGGMSVSANDTSSEGGCESRPPTMTFTLSAPPPLTAPVDGLVGA